MKSKGIDVSCYNGKIDWEKVKNAGMAFAYVRMGYSGYEGEIHMDKNFFENIRKAKNAGLMVGAYIYSYNRDEASAIKTASFAASILKDVKIDLPVAFDVEETGHDIFKSKTKEENSALCLAFFKELERAGHKGILYSYTFFIKQYLNMDMLSDFPLWIADYRDRSGENCPYKGEFLIWQYKGSEGRCPGVEGPCDLDLCFKDLCPSSLYKEKYEGLRDGIVELLEKYEKITAS